MAINLASLASTLKQLRGEAQGGLATRLMTEMMRGPLADAHSADAGPVEFDWFDTDPSVGNAQLTGTVGGGNDITLYAQTSATNEAGLIVLGRAAQQQWSLVSGAGGWSGWGIVNVSYGLNGAGSNFQPLYTATPGSGYGPSDVFAVDYRGHKHKPLSGRTIISGGGIFVRVIVRPLGVVGAVVPFPGMTLQAISSQACTLIQKMTVFAPSNYGPVHVRGMFQGAQPGQMAAGGMGRKQLIMANFGGGRIASFLNAHIGGLLKGGNQNGEQIT